MVALLFGACGVMVVRGLAAAADPALPVDDAYISFSYARTLAAGGGLRLSPAADPVEGFSEPLWVAILGLAGGLGSSIPPTARSGAPGPRWRQWSRCSDGPGCW